MMSMASNTPFPPDPAAAFSLRGRLIAAAALTLVLVGGIGLWAVTARLDAAIIFEALSWGCIPTAAYLSIHNMASGCRAGCGTLWGGGRCRAKSSRRPPVHRTSGTKALSCAWCGVTTVCCALPPSSGTIRISDVDYVGDNGLQVEVTLTAPCKPADARALQ